MSRGKSEDAVPIGGKMSVPQKALRRLFNSGVRAAPAVASTPVVSATSTTSQSVTSGAATQSREYSTPSPARPAHPLAGQRRDKYKLELDTSGSKYGNYAGQKPVIGKEKDRVLQFYDLATMATLPIVLGARFQLWQASILQNFGGLSTTPNTYALGRIKPEQSSASSSSSSSSSSHSEHVALRQLKALFSSNPDHLKTGSVLFEKYWNIAVNDAFTRGAIDGGIEVHVASEATKLLDLPHHDLYDVRHKRLKVFGRELAMLALSGYQVVEHNYPSLGIVLEPGSSSVPLKELFEFVDRAGPKEIATIIELLTTPPDNVKKRR